VLDVGKSITVSNREKMRVACQICTRYFKGSSRHKREEYARQWKSGRRLISEDSAESAVSIKRVGSCKRKENQSDRYIRDGDWTQIDIDSVEKIESSGGLNPCYRRQCDGAL